MHTRLLDAFGEAMAEHGYAEVTLAAVAARAGMARNTVYNYVGDKEALLMDYVARAVDEFVTELRAALVTRPDADDQLLELVRRQMQEFANEPGAHSDRGVIDGAMLGPEGHALLMARFAPLHDLLHDIIELGIEQGRFRAVDVDHTVRLAFSVLASERTEVGSGRRSPTAAAPAVGDFLLHALQA
jgi:AcrR family transcriptional regulator